MGDLESQDARIAYLNAKHARLKFGKLGSWKIRVGHSGRSHLHHGTRRLHVGSLLPPPSPV